MRKNEGKLEANFKRIQDNEKTYIGLDYSLAVLKTSWDL